MSSTDDSGINARSAIARTSPKRYSKRIGYGATVAAAVAANAARSKYYLSATKEIRAKASNAVARKDAKVDTDLGTCTPKGRAGWQSTSYPNASCCGGGGCGDCIVGRRRRRPANRGCVVFIVFLALLLDSLLLTCMVPIIPNYLRDLATKEGVPEPSTTTIATRATDIAVPKTTRERLTGNHVSVEVKGSRGNASFTQKRPQFLRSGFKKPTARPTETNTTYSRENTRISLLFASKTLVQLTSNLIVGPLTERIGYTVPMFSGFVVLLLSTVAFAFGNSYKLLFAARAFQGVGTALSTTSGMGLLASLYPDQTERTVAQTKAFSGLALGVLLGPPYGGILYDFLGGKEIPCLILAATALFEGALQLYVMRPRIEREPVVGVSMLTLLSDPYIIITAAAITISNLVTAVLEPALPIWMFYKMGAETWLQGVAFVPSTLSYLLFLQLFGILAPKMLCFKISHRWFCTMVGMVVLAVSTSLVPYCSDFILLISPLLLMGFGLAQVSTCMLPHIGALVDHRHQPVYGSAYAITDNAFCLAFAVGPAISGPLIDVVGFAWTLRGVAVIVLMFLPLLLMLRNPPGKDSGEEETMLVTSESTEASPDYCSTKKTTTEQ